jgi:hypothetical protein
VGPGRVGRPKARLSDQPKKRTVMQIMLPKIEELVDLAKDQGVSFDEIIELLSVVSGRKRQKSTVQIPLDESMAFFFNETHSSRSWTELRLFMLKYGVELPSRNQIDEKKKLLHPQIKSSVKYKDLIENTVQGLILKK